MDYAAAEARALAAKRAYPTKGTVVEARWSTDFGQGKEWYRGKISRVIPPLYHSFPLPDPTFDVAYDDGELEEKVRWENIRVVAPSMPLPCAVTAAIQEAYPRELTQAASAAEAAAASQASSPRCHARSHDSQARGVPPAARYRASMREAEDDGDNESDDNESDDDDLPSRSVEELKEICRRRNLSVYGQKADLVQRIVIFKRQPAPVAWAGRFGSKCVSLPPAAQPSAAAPPLRIETTPAERVSALKVCAVQLRAAPRDVEGNLRRAAELIRANPGHHLYVLPELSSCGYGDDVLANCAAFAETPTHGSVFPFFESLAREIGAHICFGFLCRTLRPLVAAPAVGSRVVSYRTPGVVIRANTVAHVLGPRVVIDVRFDQGTERPCLLAELRTPVFTIAQAVVAPTGAVELVYDKMHLCDIGACSEVGYGLTRGERPGVFTCRGWRVGVCICYDLRFPELWRHLAWEENCDLILHPSAFGRDATFPMYHTFVSTRAVENGIYVLSVNFAGAEFGESIAAPPWVGPVPGCADQCARILGCDEGVLALRCETAVLDAVRAAYPYRRNAHPCLRASAPVAVAPAVAVSPRAPPAAAAATPFALAEQDPASHRRRWTDSEISLCMSAVAQYGEKRHKAIAAAVGTRTTAQVRTYLNRLKAKVGRPPPPPPPPDAVPSLPVQVLAPPGRPVWTPRGSPRAEAQTLSALMGLQEACQQATAASAEAWAAPPPGAASDTDDEAWTPWSRD